MGWTKWEVKLVIVTTCFLLFLVFLATEIALSVFRPGPNQRDTLLGWRPKPNFSRDFRQATFGGRSYIVSYATDENGLRPFGQNRDAPIKILVMGDSFSVDPYASNNRMWYAKMAERLSQRLRKPLTDFYVMGSGGGGWGTYQQFLLSEQLKSKIRPDLFVLQFCSNDFENNYFEWERNSIVRAQFLRRPFINTEGTGPKYAPGLIASFYRSYLGQSRVLNRLDTEITRIQFQYYGSYMRPLQPNILEAYQKESISLTTRLLSKLRRQYRDIPAVMVNCDGSTLGINSVWKNMARTAGFVPISAPSDALYAIKLQNTRLDAFISDGSHFSEMGNQIFGRLLADELVAQNILLH